MADVIDFEAIKQQKERKKFDDLVDQMEEQERNLALLAIDAVLGALDRLEEYGIDPQSNPRSVVDLYLMIEATAGLICRVKGDTHGIHRASDMFMEEDFPKDPFEYTEKHEKLMREFYYGADES